jgi:hypothetical protein
MAKRLAKETSSDENYKRVVAEFLDQLIRHFVIELRAKRFEKGYIQGMSLLFAHDSRLHKLNYQIPDEEIKKLATVHQTWRAALKEGDRIDVLVKADDRSSLKGWMQGKIASVDEDQLNVIFPESSQAYDCRVERYAAEIAQFESKTKDDYEWKRTSIAEWMEVDAHDKFSWNKATLVKTDEVKIQGTDRVYPQVRVGYRIYRDATGPTAKKDERGTFEGWSEKQDDHMPVFCPRIAPWATRVKKAPLENEIEEDLDEHI